MNRLRRAVRTALRRLLRRRVPAGVGGRRGRGFDGGAGVREPRRPVPPTPAGAGAAPIPQAPQRIRLPDARQ